MSEKSKELDQRINQYTEQLLESLRRGDSGSFNNYLAFASRFHRYSYGNTLLIFCQFPDATHVAGFKTWLKMGNPVRKGQHGIKILVPYKGVREVVNRDGQAEQRPYLTFGPGTVFDISQTEHPDMAVPMFAGLGSDKAHVVSTLMRAITDDGISVAFEREGRSAGVSHGGSITVAPDIDPNNQVGTLVHEWEHEIRRRDKDTFTANGYALNELYAETVAYIVARFFDIEIPYSADYILSWNKEGAVEKLRSALTTIMQDVKYIMGKLEAVKVPELEEVA